VKENLINKNEIRLKTAIDLKASRTEEAAISSESISFFEQKLIISLN
jgi:hypothetical protein